LATNVAKRGVFLLDRLCAVGTSGISIRRLGGNRAGELRITRFLRCPGITPGEMFATATRHTATLVKNRHLLAIQDTTTLRDDGDRQSTVLHPTIAVGAEDGALLGLAHAEVLRRSGGAKAKRKRRAFEEKESHRWLRGAEAGASLLEGGAREVTVIADREGDIYEEFALRPAGVELLIRAGQDRCLADGVLLFATAAAAPVLGAITVELPAAPGRRKREARLTLPTRAIEIARPNRPMAQRPGLPKSIELTVIEARETTPPTVPRPRIGDC